MHKVEDVGRVKLLVDRYCKRVSDGRVDYSGLWLSYMQHLQYMQAMENGTGSADNESDTPQVSEYVRHLFQQWTLSAIDSRQLIDKLNNMEEIASYGGVPETLRRLLDKHQFEHTLTYGEFLRNLRNTGAPEYVAEVTVRSCKKQYEGAKHAGNADAFVAMSDAEMRSMPVRSAVSGRVLNASDVSGSSQGVAASLQTPANLDYRWEPTEQYPVGGADAAAISLGMSCEVNPANPERRHFEEPDAVGCVLSMNGNAEFERRGRRHYGSERHASQHVTGVDDLLFGTQHSLQQYEGDAGDRTVRLPEEVIAGSQAGCMRNGIGKKTYYDRNINCKTQDIANTHVAVGGEVMASSAKTTQELLWGNMIRRAK